MRDKSPKNIENLIDQNQTSSEMDDIPEVQTDNEKATNNSFIDTLDVQAKTIMAKRIYGAPTLQLREGMLSIFIRPDASSQVIHFKNLFP